MFDVILFNKIIIIEFIGHITQYIIHQFPYPDVAKTRRLKLAIKIDKSMIGRNSAKAINIKVIISIPGTKLNINFTTIVKANSIPIKAILETDILFMLKFLIFISFQHFN